jgi:DNA-binding transcriptional regulator GbsR (MarR family)
VIFKNLFTHNAFYQVLHKIENENHEAYQKLEKKSIALRELQKESKDKSEKESLKSQIADIDQQLLKVQPLDDNSYIIFYLDSR